MHIVWTSLAVTALLLASSSLVLSAPKNASTATPIPVASPDPAPDASVSTHSTTDGMHSMTGRLLERGTRKPLTDVNVFAIYSVPEAEEGAPAPVGSPPRLKATTDASGRFRFEAMPDGEFKWVVNLSGYEKLEKLDPLGPGNEQERTLYLEKSTYQVYESVTFGKRKHRDEQTKSLRADQFLTAPGSGGDPVKAVQNLPGVNRPVGLSTQVVIQGAGPNDTVYLVDGHEVPLIFHFGGLSSVLFPESLERVDYLSAGYGPEYGRANGGLIGLWSRSPRTDRYHGLAFFDIFNSGALVEGPITKDSSFLFSIRKSYIGEVLRAAFKDNSDFDFTVAPSFSDISGIYQNELTPLDTFKLTTTASLDKLEFLLKQPVESDPQFRGAFETQTAFFRLIPQLTHRHSNVTTSRFSLALGRDWIKFVNGDTYFRLQTWEISSRAEVERKVSDLWTTYLGLDHKSTNAKVEFDLPSFYAAGGVFNPSSGASRKRQTVDQTDHVVGAYTRNELKPSAGSPLTLMPNLRVDYFNPTHQLLLGPRPAARYALSETLTLRTSGGIYYQPPQPEELDPVFGNPSVTSPRAYHFTAGAEKDFRAGSSRGFVVEGDGFFKYLDNLITPSTASSTVGGKVVAENYNNDGRGRVIGAQTQIRYEGDPWSLSLAYTLSRSTRWQPGQAQYPYTFDQTHLATLLGAVNLPRNWRIAGRFRYSTGNPATPVTGGVFDADSDVYVPTRGAYYSTRLEPFYQLDVRVDKKWAFNTWMLSIYLDIQNLTNRKNPERINYSYNYRESTKTSGLPVLPTFGVKGEF